MMRAGGSGDRDEGGLEMLNMKLDACQILVDTSF